MARPSPTPNTQRAKTRNWILIAVVLVFLVGIRAFSARPMPPATYFDAERPMVIAHQGGNLLRPGNTMLAFANAERLGVDVLEMDVHATADNVLVTIHDETLDRTTDGEGAVRDHTWQQVAELDAAFHWPFDGEPTYRGRGVRIPRLDAVLQRFPKMRFNIEIKQTDPSIVGLLCATLRGAGAADRTLVASFHRSAMLEFREVCPDVATSAFQSESTVFYAHQKLSLLGIYRPEAHALQVPLERFGIELISEEIVADAAGRGMHVDAWTINDEAELRRLLSMGVGGVITDRPDLALRVRREIRN